MAKDNFIFYRQWWESIRELDPEHQSHAYDALMRFAFDGIEPEDAMIRALTTMMRSAIIRDREKYERACERHREAGRKGGRPRKEAKPNETNCNQTKPNGFSTPTEPEPPIEIAEVIPDEPSPASEHERLFDDFRRMYPGKKRGLKPEFDNFKRKAGAKWRDIIPMLIPAVERMVAWTERQRAAGQFAPNYKNLTTWINQQCWTEEFPEPIEQPITPRNNGTTPIPNQRIDQNQYDITRLVATKLTTPDRTEPDISGNY